MQVKTLVSGFVAALACGLMLAFPATAQGPSVASSSLPSVSAPTGGPVNTVYVPGGNRALFKIAVVPPAGDAQVASTVTETSSRDFVLSSLFQVLDPKSFTANLAAEGA